jgi:integrase
VRLKGAPPESATFLRKTDAQKWAQSTEAAIREGRYFPRTAAKRRTIAELLERYAHEVLPRKPRDARNQSRQLKWFKVRVGTRSLADLTPALVSELRETLKREPIASKRKHPDPASSPRYRGPATTNRYLAVLSHACAVAEREWGWLADNPVRKVKKLKEPRGRVRFLSDEERTRLLEVCRGSKHRCLYIVVVLALSTGMRLGEILSLRWSQIDLSAGYAVLHHTKNGERRKVPLAGVALEALKRLGEAGRSSSALLFPSKTNSDKPLELAAAWRRAMEKAEIQDFRFHDLRHSAASYLAMSGATVPELAAVLGHKTLQMVQRYAHLSAAHSRDVVERMNQRIFSEASA